MEVGLALVLVSVYVYVVPLVSMQYLGDGVEAGAHVSPQTSLLIAVSVIGTMLAGSYGTASEDHLL